MRRLRFRTAALLVFLGAPARANETIPAFAELLARPVRLKPELEGVHPRVFVTAEGLEMNNETRVIKLLSKVRGTYEPGKAPRGNAGR